MLQLQDVCGSACKTTASPNPISWVSHSLASSFYSIKQPFTTTELRYINILIKYSIHNIASTRDKSTYHLLAGG